MSLGYLSVFEEVSGLLTYTRQSVENNILFLWLNRSLYQLHGHL